MMFNSIDVKCYSVVLINLVKFTHTYELSTHTDGFSTHTDGFFINTDESLSVINVFSITLISSLTIIISF